MVEVFAIILFVLAVSMLSLLFAIKRKIDLFSDGLDLLSRLERLKKEFEALLSQVKAARGEARPEEEPPAPSPTKPLVAPASQTAVPEEPPPEKIIVKAAPEVKPVINPILVTEPPGGAAPRAPRWLQPVREILGRIWQWILVGEEYRPQGVTMEYAVATTWLMRSGIVAVVTCVGYFLKWSIERELIGPMGRVSVSILVGVAGLLWGLRLLGRRWNILGQGFIGGGLATLYFSMFAMGPMYHLLPVSAVFLLMILVTATAGLLSIRTDSLLIAIFGIIGGFCTPILLSTDHPNLPALYAYLFLLSLGILGIAHFKQWRLLNYLGFVFTYLVFFGSLRVYQRSDFPIAITFLALFFVVHSLLVFIYNVRRAVKSTVLEVVHLVLNAGLFSASAYGLIRDAVGRPYPAIMTLALAVFFAGQVIIFLKYQRVDRRLLLALISLAGLFATLTLPLAVEKESLTICLSLLALMFLWLGSRLESHFIRHLGRVLYGIVFFRILFMDMPRNFIFGVAAQTPITVYWQALGQRLWTFGMAIGAVAAGFLLERRRAPLPERTQIARENDMPELISPSASGQIFFWGAILCAFVFLQFECNALFRYFAVWKPAALTMLWCLLAAYFLWRYRQEGSAIILSGLGLLAAVAVLKTIAWDLDTWHLNARGCFNMAYAPRFVLARWLDFGAVLALLLAGWYWLAGGLPACSAMHSIAGRQERPATSARTAAFLFGYGALALLFLYLSLEINTLLYWNLREFQAGGISILWTLFAIGLVSGGIRWNVKLLRFLGLALFTVVVGKVFLVDLESTPIIFRMIAFLVVGIALLLGSFAYLFSAGKFKRKAGNDQVHAGK